MDIKISREEEGRLLNVLADRTDTEAARIRRCLAMPDLSRTPLSPLNEIVERVKAVPSLHGFDVINIPEIVSTHVSFDLFDFPPNHPVRSRSDTYYVDDSHILRTHDTVFWYYYLRDQYVLERIARGESLGALCYGKVYRKDEIDRRHMNIFHQMGGWYLQKDSKGLITLDVLKNVLSEIVRTIFGNVEYRFADETFPYTDPSTEVEVKIGDEWIEILGSGLPKKSVLKKLNLEGYNGWAFGFGLERLAIISMQLPDIRLLWSPDERVRKQLILGREYLPVSKYPAIIRDISFIVNKSFVPNDYFDLVRDIAGDLVEEVELVDTYENPEKLGAEKISYSYRVTYRSIDKTLTNDEVNALHKELESATHKQFEAQMR